MLVKSPYVQLINRYGYDGIDNIYDYWQKNKTGILTCKLNLESQLDEKSEDYNSFLLKLRWASPVGVRFKMILYNWFEKVSVEAEIAIEDIKIRGLENPYTLMSFSEDYKGLKDALVDYHDLRGLTIVRATVRDHYFENIDFSWSSLESNLFENVSFKNCRFTECSFNNSHFINCTFDSQCKLKGVDFSNCSIDANFNSVIDQARITKIDYEGIEDLAMNRLTYWKRYTDIRGGNFIEMNSDHQIKAYCFRLEKHLKNIDRIKNEKLVVKVFFIVKLKIMGLIKIWDMESLS